MTTTTLSIELLQLKEDYIKIKEQLMMKRNEIVMKKNEIKMGKNETNKIRIPRQKGLIYKKRERVIDPNKTLCSSCHCYILNEFFDLSKDGITKNRSCRRCKDVIKKICEAKKNMQKVQCECGKLLHKYSLQIHLESKRHKNKMMSIEKALQTIDSCGDNISKDYHMATNIVEKYNRSIEE